MSLSRHAQASEIAAEHVDWCKANDVSPRQVILSIGLKAPPVATWDHAFVAIALVWLNLEMPSETRQAA